MSFERRQTLVFDGSRNVPTSTKKPRENQRGSADAIRKRRAARHFNDLVGGAGPAARLDGRTEKRRLRLREELKRGVVRASGQPLKPIEVLLRVQELASLGEPWGSIKKVCRPARPVAGTQEVVDGVRRLHAAYGFAAEAYQFVGIDDATLKKARVLGGLKKASRERSRRDLARSAAATGGPGAERAA
jgi:hypothetical protein